MSNLITSTSGIEMIHAERIRQINEEGFTIEKDAKKYTHMHLTSVAIAYAMGRPFYLGLGGSVSLCVTPESFFETSGWGFEWFKRRDRVRDLVKAGALIAAEIDRELFVNLLQK